MTMTFWASLRARLVVLVLIAIIPALGLILYTGVEMRRTASVEAQANALRLAQSISGAQDDLLEGARQLLTTLAQIPVARGSDPVVCKALFSTLLKKYPRYANLGVTTPAGDAICSGLPLPGPTNFADRAWFQRALESRDFVTSEYLFGRISRKAIVSFAYPILDEAREVQAVLFAGLDLDWLNGVIAKTELPASATLTVIDRKGTILARFPNPEKWVGKSIAETPVVWTILSQGEGTTEAVGMDGVPRLYGFSSLGNTRDAYISIGIPRDVAFATANRLLARNLVALGIVGVLALVAAWFGADLFVLRRVNDLVSTTKRLTAGDLRARTALRYGKGELSELARAFDQMAASMEQLITERKRAEQRLTSLHEINIAMTSSLDLHAVLNVLMEKIDLFLPYTAVLVWLRNRESGLLERAACWNLDEEDWKGRKLASTPPLVKAAMEGKAPVVASNVQTDPRTLDPDLYRRHGLVSYLGVPLLTKGEALGVLVFLTREEHKFTNEEIVFLSTLAGQAAIAIHNSQLHEQAKNQALELEKANKVKDEFLGLVSHELRTPVNAVLGYAAMIQDGLYGEVHEEQRETLGKIINRSHDLLSMVNSLLEATRIEAGGVRLERNEVHLSEFLAEVRSTYDIRLDKELTLIWDYPSDLPTLETDRDKLRHILQNLVNNAIKYTDRGSVTIAARMKEGSRQQAVGGGEEPSASHLSPQALEKWVEFKVTDTGIGIPKESLPSIFEMFRQVKGLKNGSRGGVGLGLHIVKKFAELLGGKIEVESELGKGSTFTVTMPWKN